MALEMRYNSRTRLEHKTLESNKSVLCYFKAIEKLCYKPCHNQCVIGLHV